MRIELPTRKMAGLFKINHFDINGNIKNDLPWQTNVITDAGMEAILLGEPWFRGTSVVDATTASAGVADSSLIRVGSGNQDFTTASTDLVAEILPPDVTYKTDMGDEYDYLNQGKNYDDVTKPYKFLAVKSRIIFNSTQVVSELGLSDTLPNYDTSADVLSKPMYTLARIRDVMGNLTGIHILPGEYLDIIYELREYPEQVANVDTVPIDFYGTFKDFTVHSRWADAYGMSTALDAPSGTGLGVPGGSNLTLDICAYGDYTGSPGFPTNWSDIELDIPAYPKAVIPTAVGTNDTLLAELHSNVITTDLTTFENTLRCEFRPLTFDVTVLPKLTWARLEISSGNGAVNTLFYIFGAETGNNASFGLPVRPDDAVAFSIVYKIERY